MSNKMATVGGTGARPDGSGGGRVVDLCVRRPLPRCGNKPDRRRRENTARRDWSAPAAYAAFRRGADCLRRAAFGDLARRAELEGRERRPTVVRARNWRGSGLA